MFKNVYIGRLNPSDTDGPTSYNDAAIIFAQLAPGVDVSDAKALKKAYRTVAGALHPDVGGDAAKFRRLKAAYDLLAAHALGKAVHTPSPSPSQASSWSSSTSSRVSSDDDPLASWRAAQARAKTLKRRWAGVGRGTTLWEALVDDYNTHGDMGSSDIARARERNFKDELEFYAADAWAGHGKAEAKRTKTRKADWIADWKDQNADQIWQWYEWPFNEAPFDDETCVDTFLGGEEPEIEAYLCPVHGDWTQADPTDLMSCPQCGMPACPACMPWSDLRWYCGNCGFETESSAE